MSATLAAPWLALAAFLTMVPVSIKTASALSTSLSPGAAAVGNTTMVTTIAPDGRILYTWWALGEGGHGWREVEGGGRTDTSAAASFEVVCDVGCDARPWSVIRGYDGNIYTNTADGLGLPFLGWRQLPGVKTNVAPSAVVPTPEFGTNFPIVMATATDGRIVFNVQGCGWTEVPGNGRTDTSPAAALADTNYMFVVARGINDHQLYLQQGSPYGAACQPGGWVGWVSLGLQTNFAAAVASSGSTTSVVATSPDGRILYDWWGLGEGGHGWVELPGGGRTDAAPAAALVGSDHRSLFVVVKGLDGQLYLNQGQLGGSFVGWQPM